MWERVQYRYAMRLVPDSYSSFNDNGYKIEYVRVPMSKKPIYLTDRRKRKAAKKARKG